MYYIQRRDSTFKTLETVDEFDTKKEALEMLKEYQLYSNSVRYYISTRACKDWKNK